MYRRFSATVRSGEKKTGDGAGGDHNQQRIDAALGGGSVGVDFWGHEVERVLWDSGEGFKKSLVNWQGNFLNFLRKT